MKRYAAYCFFMIVAGVFNSIANSPEKDSYFGIKAGFDINLPSDWHNSSGKIDMYRHGFGFNIGGVYNGWLGKGFYLEPGVSVYYDSYSYKDLIVDDVESDSDPKIYKIGVRIPVVAGYEFDITEIYSMTLFTGPELNYSFSGKYVVNNPQAWGDFLDTLFKTQRRIDCAWKVGVGFPVNNFMLSIEGAFGMTDLLKNPDISFRENRCTIGLTYYFK